MEWISITEQPMPKDGKKILVNIVNNVGAGMIYAISWHEKTNSYIYYDTGEFVSESFLSCITAWTYYPEQYKG